MSAGEQNARKRQKSRKLRIAPRRGWDLRTLASPATRKGERLLGSTGRRSAPMSCPCARSAVSCLFRPFPKFGCRQPGADAKRPHLANAYPQIKRPRRDLQSRWGFRAPSVPESDTSAPLCPAIPPCGGTALARICGASAGGAGTLKIAYSASSASGGVPA